MEQHRERDLERNPLKYAFPSLLIHLINFSLLPFLLLSMTEFFLLLRDGAARVSAQKTRWMCSAISGANADLLHWIDPLASLTFRTA